MKNKRSSGETAASACRTAGSAATCKAGFKVGLELKM